MGLFLLRFGVFISTFYIIYVISLWDDIENKLRLIGVVILLLMLVILVTISLRLFNRLKGISFYFLFFIYLIYIFGLLFVAFNIHQVYFKIKGVSKNYIVYSTSLVTINSDSETIDGLSDGEIGIYDNEESIDAYQLPLEIIEKRNLTNQIVYMDSYLEIFEGLEEGEITYAFLPTNFAVMFGEIEELKEVISKIRVIYTEEIKVEQEKRDREFDINKPITFLLMGIDSRAADISMGTFNGDALMVITFNPQTLNATILSIPRDTYVPIACFSGQRKNKITHAAWFGESCMKQTIEQWLDIEIDYTVKMNFRGLVTLVDLVEGIEVDVPYSFCEQDSRSRWGDNTVFVMEGLQTLDGEQALALTRNRKNNTNKCGYGINGANDFVRGQNQQLVLRALLEKLKDIRSVNKIQEILDELSKMMETNMETKEILAFYNVFKDIFVQTQDAKLDDVVWLKRLYISGYDQYIFDYSQIHNQGIRVNLYNFVPYQASLDEIKEAIKINLGLIEWQRSEHFSFDVREPYQEIIVGKGRYSEARIALLPDFKTYSLANIQRYASDQRIELKIEHVDNNGQYQNGQIISQFPNPNTDLEFINLITIRVAKDNQQTSYIDCSEPNLENCSFPNLIGLSYSQYLSIKARYQLNWSEVKIDLEDERYNADQALKIVSQSVSVGTDIYEILTQLVIVEYMGASE